MRGMNNMKFKVKMIGLRAVFGTLRWVQEDMNEMHAIFLIDISVGKHPLGRQMSWIVSNGELCFLQH